MRKKLVPISTAIVAVMVVAASAPADARRRHHHHGYGYGAGGFVAGAILSSALAGPRYGYYGNGPYYYGGGRYYSDAYASSPDSEEYCMQRFRSYDPRSGTYMGYDGQRHACP
jgi:hypothetical protein